MDIRSLRYFISAAHYLNFTKAANECFITQTAISLNIAKLEEELNFKLFYRNNHRVTLTAGGRVFLEEAQKMLNCYENAVTRGYSASLGYEGVLKIGFPNYMERLFLPKVVKLFHKRYPKIELDIKQDEQWIMTDEIKNGTNDITMVFPYELEKDGDICVEKLATYQICAVVNQEHRFAQLPKVNAQMLENETFIIIGSDMLPNIYRRMWSEWTEYGFKPKKIIETKSLDSILFMVEIGFGIALLPSYIKQVPSQELVFVDLEGDNLHLDMVVAYLRSNNNPALKLFLGILEDEQQK